MNCSRFETLLSDFLDRALEPPVYQAAEEHFQGCTVCRELASEVERLRGQLADFPSVRPPEDLVEKILERTSGRPRSRSLWADLILPTLQPFMTQRYAFATIVLFVFLSLMVNLAGPPVAAVLSPSRLAEEADRFSSQVSKQWAELQDFKTRVAEEISLMRKDLYGRIDYHLISLLFKSYEESVEEQESNLSQEGQEGTAQE